jgi:hypothetical protein
MLIAFDGPARGRLPGPAVPVQQPPHRRHRAVDGELPGDQRSDPRHGPPLVLPAMHGRSARPSPARRTGRPRAWAVSADPWRPGHPSHPAVRPAASAPLTAHPPRTGSVRETAAVPRSVRRAARIAYRRRTAGITTRHQPRQQSEGISNRGNEDPQGRKPPRCVACDEHRGRHVDGADGSARQSRVPTPSRDAA